MTVEMLSATTGVILSLAFSYVPGLSKIFDELEPIYKRIVMLLLLVLVAGGSLVLACTGYAELFNVGVTCDQVGIRELWSVFLAAVIANQGAYMITPKK
jgi:hypothetical protein